MDTRRVELSSDIFGGFYCYINMDEYRSNEEICAYLKNMLYSHLVSVNLTKLSDLLMTINIEIHTDFVEILASNDIIWACDCDNHLKIIRCECDDKSTDDEIEGILESMKLE